MTAVSLRQFAALDGCSLTLVRNGIKRGTLVTDENGRLDPALAGTGWRKTNRQALAGTPAQRAAKAVENAVEIPPIADSEAKKEFFLAKLRELEYDLKSSLVSPNAEQVRIVDAAFARVRTRLLAMPSEAAPALHRCRTVAEVQAELLRIITEILEELSGNGGGRVA